MDEQTAVRTPSMRASATDDARWQRTEGSLRRAVLELAAEMPAHRITMTMLAHTAEVSRSAAYEHTPSASVLLEHTLGDELDILRREYLHDLTPAEIPAAIARVTRRVVEHIDAYSSIYRLGLIESRGRGNLHRMLSTHFANSVRLLLDAHGPAFDIPGRSVAERAAITEMIIRGIADGAAGQLTAWVALPEPRDPDLFLAANNLLLPSWWSFPQSTE